MDATALHRIAYAAVAVVLAACSGEGVSPERAAGTLHLTVEQAHRVRHAGIPSSVMVLAPDSLLAVDGTSAGAMLHVRHAPPAWITAPEPLHLLIRDGSSVLASGVATLYRIDPFDTAAAALWDVPVRAGSIVSMASSGDHLWIVSADSRGSVAELHHVRKSGPGPWRSIRLAGPVKLETGPAGGVYASLVSAPHTLFQYDSSVARIDSVVAGRRRSFFRRGSTSHPPTATQALIALDRERLLHMVVDLRTGARTAYLYDTNRSLRLLRRRELGGGTGLVHSMPAEPLLVGLSTGQGWWEAVLLRWSWNPN